MPFEPQQDDLRVEQRESADDRVEAGEGVGVRCRRFTCVGGGQRL
jgi:hypothetical protein